MYTSVSYLSMFLLLFVTVIMMIGYVFFFKQNTAYELCISDLSSDVCSSDLQVIGRIAAEDFLGRDQQRFKPVLRRLVGEARADLVARGKDDFAGLGVDDIERRLRAAPVLGDERNLPAILGALENDAVIEEVEDFLTRHATFLEQRSHRQLALAVDADVDDVLGVEFDIEPRAEIGRAH